MFVWLRRWLIQESSGIAASALLVSGASLLSRLLGVVRDRLLAGHFGAGTELDAYYAAFRIPDTLFNLLIAGALSAGFIPLFSEYLEQRSEKDAWRLAAQVLTILTSIMAVCALIFIVIAPWVVPLFTKGFSAEGVRLTIDMTRIMALSPILLGISGVMGGILQAKKRFLAFALAPVFYNLGIIIGITLFASFWGVRGVAWGVVLGSFLHACLQAWPAFHLGFKGIGARPWWGEGVGRLLQMMIPRTASLAVTQVNLLIILALASSLSVGSVSLFTLATNIQSLPFGLIGVSVAVAVFPVLSQAVNQKSDESFQRILREQLAWLWFLLVPVSILFYFLAPELVYLVLGTGKFQTDQVSQTADILRLLVIALPSQSMIALLVRAFYAKQDTWTPFFVSIVAEGMNLLFCLVLRGSLGLRGLAIAFTVSTIINALGLWMTLPRSSSVTQEKTSSTRTVVGVSIAGLLMILVAKSSILFFAPQNFSLTSVIVRSFVLAVLTCAAYLGIVALFRLPESKALWTKIRSVF